MNRHRLLALPLALLIAGAAGACNATTYTSSCADGVCTVTLSGAGADGDVNGGQILVELDGASDGEATFAVDGEEATCAQGDQVAVAGYDVTCTEVGDDRLTIEIR